jgi:hypothetical protein
MASIFNFRAFLLVLGVAVFSIALAHRVSAQGNVPGQAVKCGCYCGAMTDPPCSDQKCKTACGDYQGPNVHPPAQQQHSVLWLLVVGAALLALCWIILFGFHPY